MGKSEITNLLQQWSGGSPEAFDHLVPLVYDELRHMAGGFLRGEREGHLLQPTALVHELYLRMVDQERAQWQDRSHFFAVAAKMMRRILVDHARKRVAAKRGGGAEHIPIEDALDHPAQSSITVLAIDEALTRFAAFDPERSRIVELRYFAGLELEEIAELLQVSRTTVKRHWTVARMWLHRELEADRNGLGALEGD
ncbi:MAG: sigma-70 family RNA polymerase sigma factor [Bryobacter sp.]|jgi:RNA polymerase sigma factor (TIGR02999 family)|nr:sigma-70 family RNA polymerase sigma factor [Bryobacter sp.]